MSSWNTPGACIWVLHEEGPALRTRDSPELPDSCFAWSWEWGTLKKVEMEQRGAVKQDVFGSEG